MRLEINLPLLCPADMTSHLEKVFSGEYDVPNVLFAAPPRILDLGANCGAFSVWASHRWPGSSISAYEPQPHVFHILKENIKGYPNVSAHREAFGTPGFRTLHSGQNNCGEASFHRTEAGRFGESLSLEVRAPRALPEAEIIKLDVEGCELEILAPLIDAGRSFVFILLEYHSEELRREIDWILGPNYSLVGSEVQHPAGRGIVKYAHKSITKGFK